MEHLDETISKVGLYDATAVPTPSVEAHLKEREESPELDNVRSSIYRSAFMGLLHFGVDRNDGEREIRIHSQYLSQPKEAGWTALKGLVRYYKGVSNDAAPKVTR